MSETVVPIVLFCAAVLLWCGPRPSLARLDQPQSHTGARSQRAVYVAVAAVVGIIAVISGHPGWVVGIAILGGLGWWAVRRAVTHKRTAATQQEALRAVSELSLLLRSGMIPQRAVAEAARTIPILRPAADASHLGVSLSAALATAAQKPGAQTLQLLASSWAVSEATGAPIAGILDEVAHSARERRRVEAEVEAELSAARTSSRILAGLPLVGLGLGAIVGANTLGFLLGHPLGEYLFLGSALLTAAGLLWTERIAEKVWKST